MSNKFLGAVALLTAPFLFIGFWAEAENPALSETWFTGAWGLLYMTGWTGSVTVLQRKEATGRSLAGKSVLWTLLACLVLGNVSNVLTLVYQQHKPAFYWYLDLFWPLSNAMMLLTGFAVLFAKKLHGWKRYVPLAAGLWLPLLSLLRWLHLPQNTWMMISGAYSNIAWSVLAFVSLLSDEENNREDLPKEILLANHPKAHL